MISFFITLTRFINGIWKGSKDPEFRGLLFFVIVLLLSGTFFYVQVEKWRIVDAFYFSVTTLATVGFGDFHPQTDAGKIFTVLYILLGVGTLLGFVDLVARHTKPEDPFKHFIKNDKENKEKTS